MKNRLVWLLASTSALALLAAPVDGRGFGGFGGARGGMGGAGGMRMGGGGYGGMGGNRGFGGAGGFGGGDRGMGGMGGGDRGFGNYGGAGRGGMGAGGMGAGGMGAGGMGDRGMGGGERAGGYGDRGAGGMGAGGMGERGAGEGGAFGAYGGAGRGMGEGGAGYGAGRMDNGAYGAYGRGVAGEGAYGRWGEAGYGHFAGDGGLAHYGPYGGVGGYGTHYWNNGELANQAGYVRGAWNHWGCFGPGWWGRYPGAWYAPGLAGYSAWNAANWSTLANWCSLAQPPIYYDYGNTVTYQGNDVYVNGDSVGSAAQYGQQATSLAAAGAQAQPAANAQWQPLGVFAVVQGSQTSSNNVFQLAIDQNGVLRGNYYDAGSDQATPVYGSLDKASQRIAWTVGKDNKKVYETGLNNLTKDQFPILVHLGDGKTQQLLMVRLNQPSGQGGANAAGASAVQAPQ